MSQPIDSQTPLLLRSEYRARANIKSAADTDNRLLSIIVQASQAFQAACGRRFDEYIETRYYTPFHMSEGGDLLSMRKLRLDADLKSYTAITNGDASAITAGNVTLEPLNGAYKTAIRLNPYGIQFWYHSGTTDPIGSISVAGIWGYGGQWVDTGATVQGGGYTANATALTSSAALETGMVLKIGTEYQYISAVVGMVNTVTPAFNGSTSAAHSIGVPIYRWKAQDTVQKCVARLIAIELERNKAPLFGQVVVGDVVFPVNVDGYPNDVIADVRNAKLKWIPRLQAV